MSTISVIVNSDNPLFSGGGQYLGLTNMPGWIYFMSSGDIQWGDVNQSNAHWYGNFTYTGSGLNSVLTGGTLTATGNRFRPGYSNVTWTGMSEDALVVANAMSTANFAVLDALFADDTFIYTNNNGVTSAPPSSFHGYGGDDQLYGGAHVDTLEGRGGNDILSGGLGNDSLNGGDGIDTVELSFASTAVVSITGTPGNLVMVSPEGTDSLLNVETLRFSDGYRTPLQLLTGDDYAASLATTGSLAAISATFGTVDSITDRDWFRANLGAGIEYTFIAYGGTLANAVLRLYDANGALIASNSSANTSIVFTAPATAAYYLDVGALAGVGGYYVGIGVSQSSGLNAESNYLTLSTGGGAWHAFSGDDVINGSTQTDILFGDEGYDSLYGAAGNDFLVGGLNDDVLAGDAGNDVLDGGDGGDILSELAADQSSGDDIFHGGNGVDIMYSSAGHDIVYGGGDAANNYGNLGDGNDTYFGSLGSDVVVAGNGSDVMSGGSGDDSLYGEAGNDGIYGGEGIDLLSGSAGNDILDGGDANDLLVGDDGDDLMLGGTGIDVLYGFAGNDVLDGGLGGNVDALYGGAGFDSFRVGGSSYGIDYIWDFAGGIGPSDQILIKSGATITSQFAASGNYYLNLSTGSQAVIVGVTSVFAEDIVPNGF